MERLTPLFLRLRARSKQIHTLFSLVGINAVLAGVSFFTTLAIANSLGKEAFGEVSYALTMGAYCFTIAYCGLEVTLVRDLVQGQEHFDSTVSASILLRGVMLVLGFVVIVGADVLGSGGAGMGLASIVIVLAEGLKALYLAAVYDARHLMKRHAFYILLERCLYFAGVWCVLILLKDHFSIATISIFMFLSTVFGLGIQYLLAPARVAGLFEAGTITAALRMIRSNLWIWGAILATLSIGGLSKILLMHISGSGELGGYAVAWQIILLSSILISQVGRMANPRLARVVQPSVARAQRIRFLARYTALSALAGSAFGVPAVLFPGVILRLFSSEYAGFSGTLRILGVYAILLGVGQVGAQYLIAVRRVRLYSLVFIFTACLSLILNYTFIPLWGGQGAALAVVASHGSALAVYAAFTWYLLSREGKAVIGVSEPETEKMYGKGAA